MTTIPATAAVLYGLSVTIDLAADRGRDARPVIDAGRTFTATIGNTPPGRASVYLRDAGATFLRAWARHEPPDKAADLIRAAEDLETARDLAIATMPRLDA